MIVTYIVVSNPQMQNHRINIVILGSVFSSILMNDVSVWEYFFYQKLFHRLECFSPSGRLKKSRPPPLVIENSNFFNFSDAERKVKQCSSPLCAKEKEPTFKQQETPLASCFYVISSIQLVCKVFIIYNKNI